MKGIVVWGGILESPNHQFTIRQIRPRPRAHEFWDFGPPGWRKGNHPSGRSRLIIFKNFGQIKEL